MKKRKARSGASFDEADVERALKSLEGKDRLGTAGEVAGVAGGTAAGVAAAGAVAGALGGTTLLGSSTLASVLGGVLVTTTPVGWVVGCAALGGAAAYAVSKVIRSGGRQDEIRRRLAKAIVRRRVPTDTPDAAQITEAFHKELKEARKVGALAASDATRMRRVVSQGHLPVEVALRQLRLVTQAHRAARAKP